MRVWRSLSLFSLLILITTCSKNSKIFNPRTQIDVSAQWVIDPAITTILSLGDGQWQSRIFTTEEQNLFTSLDTADLTGTSTPSVVIESPSRYYCIFPNPFPLSFRNYFILNPGYAGQFVLKTVIVDSLMNSIEKSAIRVTANSNLPNPSYSNVSTFQPTLSPGRYRLYFTLSSLANPHFYKSWGNIQKF